MAVLEASHFFFIICVLTQIFAEKASQPHIIFILADDFVILFTCTFLHVHDQLIHISLFLDAIDRAGMMWDFTAQHRFLLLIWMH